MRWLTVWQVLVALAVRAHAQAAAPTICHENYCRCDPFSRVLCSCTKDYELTLRPDGAYRVPSTTTAIIINGCTRVHFLPDTARNLLHLHNIALTNIDHVVINERALAWSPFAVDSENHRGLQIEIRNSTINEISPYAIQGRVDNITISDSKIENVRPFAFSSLTGVRNIELNNNVLGNIVTQAFKQFTTDNFVLRGGTVETLPSRFLSDVEVRELFLMNGVTVNHISSVTFLVNSPKKVLIDSNMIGNLEPDSFHMSTRGPITLRNNTITTFARGALLGFTVAPEVTNIKGRQDMLVDNNTIMNLAPSSLLFNRTTLTLRLDGLKLNVSCTCELVEEWKEVFAEHGGIVNCWYDLKGHFVSLPTFSDSRCGRFKQTFWIFVVIGIIAVLLVAGLVTFFIVRRENQKKKKVQIVMPDGKTYRETEFHIVVERAELLTTDL